MPLKKDPKMMGPNQAISDKVLELLKDREDAATRPDSEWAKLRARAYAEDNIMDGAAITCAQYVIKHGSIEPIERRVLELLGTQEINKLESILDWKEARSSYWTKGDLLTVAAMAYIEHLFHYRPRYHRV